MMPDLVVTVRRLTRTPGYAMVVVLTLALGVAAATTVFTVVDEVLLTPPPLPHVDRLFFLWATDQQHDDARSPPAVADILDFREATGTLENIAITRFWFYTFTLDGPGRRARPAEQVHGWRVSPGYFSMLGVEPGLGRSFRPDEGIPGNDRVAVITHGLWQRRFDGRPDIIGQTIRADGERYEIVGVLGPDFYPFRVLDKAVELWLPFAPTSAERVSRASAVGGTGLLRPDWTLAQAQAELDQVAQQLADRHPETNRYRGVELVSFDEAFTSAMRTPLIVLSGAVALVLVVALVNIVGLTLARSATRGRELAIRRALGAHRSDVVRQAVLENIFLAALGGLLASVLSVWSIRAVAVLLADDLPSHVQLGIDWHALSFVSALSLGTALVVSVIPVAGVFTQGAADTLKAATPTATLGRRPLHLRQLLVVGQLALTTALLVTAGLMLQTVRHLVTADRGVSLSDRLTLQIRLGDGRYDSARVASFYDEVLLRVRALPGVRSAALSSFLPLSDVWAGTTYDVRGRAGRPDEVLQAAYWVVSDDVFETLGLPLQAGRGFSTVDGPDTQLTAVVSQSLANRVWPNRSPLGQQLRMQLTDADDVPWNEGATNDWLTVVGVADDYRVLNEAERRLEPGQALYVAASQLPRRMMHLIVHTAGTPSELAAPVREAIAAVDPSQPVSFVRSYSEVVFTRFDHRRVLSVLLSAFAAMGIGLTIVGTFGLLSYQVTQRRREFAVRLAVGAAPSRVLALVARAAGGLGGAGLALGLGLTAVTTPVVRRQLYGVDTLDGMIYTTVALLLAAVVAVAGWWPARRAMATQPAILLREE